MIIGVIFIAFSPELSDVFFADDVPHRPFLWKWYSEELILD